MKKIIWKDRSGNLQCPACLTKGMVEGNADMWTSKYTCKTCGLVGHAHSVEVKTLLINTRIPAPPPIEMVFPCFNCGGKVDEFGQCLTCGYIDGQDDEPEEMTTEEYIRHNY